jgi:hypothetical protein
MRPSRVLPALAALATALVATAAVAQPAPPADSVAPATLFFPLTVARTEERSYAGTATWRMIDLGPTEAVEAVVTFAGAAADLILVIEENPFAELPDDILVHAWPRWPATAEGPAVASAYLVGLETPVEAQLGLVGTARGDYTIGLMASAAPRNHERLRAASVLIVELGLPDGKAYVALPVGDAEHRLIERIIPEDGPALPFAGGVEQRILGANGPDGTGGVFWDTPRTADGAVAARARIYLYDRGIGLDVVFEYGPAGLVVTTAPADAAAAAVLGSIAGLSIGTPDGALPLAGGAVSVGGGESRLVFAGEHGADGFARLAAGGNGFLILAFIDGAAGALPVAIALPQSWNPFVFLAAP